MRALHDNDQRETTNWISEPHTAGPQEGKAKRFVKLPWTPQNKSLLAAIQVDSQTPGVLVATSHLAHGVGQRNMSTSFH